LLALHHEHIPRHRPNPVLNDNYVWLMREPQSGAVGVVDPAVAGPVLAEAAKRRSTGTFLLS
jgi:hydroxyacylglutathione hydrolase